MENRLFIYLVQNHMCTSMHDSKEEEELSYYIWIQIIDLNKIMKT
jgi:hypothetical protein